MLQTTAQNPITRNRSVSISEIKEERSGNTSRVTAKVNDFPVWYESEDTVLRASPEAFGSALLVAGLLQESQLVFTDPLSPAWRQGVSMLLHVFNEWWGLPYLPPQSPEASENTSGSQNGHAKETALLFSGGVDSFYSLLRGRFPPDRLVFILGYDIPLEDKPRMDAFYNTFVEVASKMNKKRILIKTNLRDHPLVGTRNWMQIHGGALAGTGHLLSNEVGRFLISSTNPYSVSLPWGSHWRIDELWSSENLHVVHIGAERSRNDKLRSIASESIVQNNLRVCLENNSPTGNCSFCEKCLRTMLVLHQMGKLEQFKVFDLSESLETRFKNAKPPIQTMGILLKGYEDILKRGLTPSLDRAVRDFINRYEVAKKTRAGRLRRMLGPRVTTWLRTRIYDS